MKERDIEALLRDGVKQLGGKAYKWVSPGNAGVPDRIVILPGGKVIFVELKQENGQLTRLQKIQQDTLRAMGAAAVTLYGADEVRMYLEELKEMLERGAKAARISELLH
ncbi:VRR-NUC domain-containing protein [uncultured Selenomonas sp.]|uniref:VRR-NUC domain-containing protein n=1 Tax=uncultured Selenomonas sp. TaxID=159275 RepID=UPI0028D4FC5C|nr:VRR-NUC domain-containing protein [uncultured Selenomonas sp.]